MANNLKAKARTFLRSTGWQRGFFGNWTPPWIEGFMPLVRGVYPIDEAVRIQNDLNLASPRLSR